MGQLNQHLAECGGQWQSVERLVHCSRERGGGDRGRRGRGREREMGERAECGDQWCSVERLVKCWREGCGEGDLEWGREGIGEGGRESRMCRSVV